MSHLGVARDLYAGFLQMEEMQTKMNTPSVSDFHVDERTFAIKVEVADQNRFRDMPESLLQILKLKHLLIGYKIN